MLFLHVLVILGAVSFGSSQNCCQPNTNLTAPLNQLQAIRVACQPRFTSPCKWTVTAPPGAVIGVEITSATIEYPSIVETKNDAGSILNTVYGEGIFTELKAAGTFFTIEIDPSGLSGPETGEEVLVFKYVASIPTDTATACGNPPGETIELDMFGGGKKCISSPNFPNRHDNDAHCTWTIESAYGIGFNVVFFYLEDWSTDDIYCYDPVKINGEAKEYCARSLHSTSRTNQISPVVVDFTTDFSVTLPGFLICFETLESDNDDVIIDTVFPLAAVFVAFSLLFHFFDTFPM
ncbi:blastula protease 10-like [Pecten maximus]|uniref:blastula protease 10-like n=1 Tax=Pecten maximus TaxID=6579 RepID=UPI00145884A4|nr:blastula protease 10-like [Pecten maximus]